ncbi:MAG TPA: hypothetical protein PKB02_15535 [Anaerohalosphaeraceae bacterium]|nr:hypothetical protein [Anaerohalosphaeraceae bacterium]
MTKYGYYLLALLVLGSSWPCFSQRDMPYWDAEVVYGYFADPNFLTYNREVVIPKGGDFYEFAPFAVESYKDACAKFFPEEIEFLIKSGRNLRVSPGHQIPLMVQLSQIKNNQGFRHIEGLCILLQDGPDELFLSFESNLSLDEIFDLGTVQQLAGLKHLEIYGCSLKNINIQNLSKLKSLEYIGLPIDSNDATVDLLLSLNRLQFINASGTRITGAHFEELAKLPNLEILDLRYTRLAENAISKLKNAKNLKTLLLTGAEVTDKHLEGIEQLKGLQNLALTKTKVTDSALKRIEQLPNLRYVTLGQTQVTSPNLQILQSSNPNLTISLNPVITWEEYQVKNLYRQAVLYGDADAQMSIFRRYYDMFYLLEKKLYSEEQYKKMLSRPDPLQKSYDPIELLKWSYIILHPRKSVQEVEQLKTYIPSANEAKEVLEKRLYVGEIAEARRRAELTLSLINDYKLTHTSKYEYLPIYQVKFSFIDAVD